MSLQHPQSHPWNRRPCKEISSFYGGKSLVSNPILDCTFGKIRNTGTVFFILFGHKIRTNAQIIMKLDVRCRDNILNHILGTEDPTKRFLHFMGENDL